MSQIRNVVINKIIDILIIITSKEWGRLTVIVIIIIIVLAGRYLIAKAKREIALVDELYGRENLAPRLGRKDLKYPIIGFEGDLAEPIQVVSRDDFKRDYTGGIGVKYVVDAELKKHNVQNIRLGDIGGTDPRIAKIKFPKVESSQERIDFEEMKTQMIKKIKKDKMSCYVGLENEMELTKNIHELVQVMNKGEF